eukprot:m51a1_g13638 hypothetical protein (283) ;mRNA; f:739-1793
MELQAQLEGSSNWVYSGMRPYREPGAAMWGTFTVSLSVGTSPQISSSPRVEFTLVCANGPLVIGSKPFYDIHDGQNEVSFWLGSREVWLLRFNSAPGAHEQQIPLNHSFYALLVGVNSNSMGQYLCGAENDVRLMRGWTHRYLRRPEDEVVLLRGDATARNIVQELRKMAGTARKGDVLLFYFSGLGTTSTVLQGNTVLQIPDVLDKPLWTEGRNFNVVTSVDVMEALYPALYKGATVNLILDCSFSGVEDTPIDWPVETLTPDPEWLPEYVCDVFGSGSQS